MRLQVDGGGPARVVTLSIDASGATVGDLAVAVGLPAKRPLLIDGCPYPASRDLTEVPFVDGAHITTLIEGSTVDEFAREVWLGVVNGPGTGSMLRTHPGTVISIGRDHSNDFVIDNTTVSSFHARLHVSAQGRVEVEDLGSRNGTRVGGVHVFERSPLAWGQTLQLGSSSVRLEEIDVRERTVGSSPRHADGAGHIVLNRPPRAPVVGGPPPVAVPSVVETKSSPRLAVFSLLVPLVFAGVMVVVLGSWRYALFGLLSPAMAIGNWASSRRQVGKERVRASRREVEEIATFSAAIDSAASQERLRRQHFAPDVLELRRRIELPTRHLWERRGSAADAFAFRLGTGMDPWKVPLETGDGVIADEVQHITQSASLLSDAEVVVDLRRGHIGVIGDVDAGAGLVRSAIIQLATHHGPADVQVVVLTSQERRLSWRWTHWLPHCSQMANVVSRVVCGEEAHAFASSLLSESDGISKTITWLVVVDDPELIRGRGSAVRELLAEGDVALGLVVAESIDELPSSVKVVVEATSSDGEFTMWSPEAPDAISTGILDLLAEDDATDLGSAMARFHDSELDAVTGTLPPLVRGADLHEVPTRAEITARWAQRAHDQTLTSVVGIGPAGPLEIDMVADGPHALVAGTTGSGKSEFLRTLVLGMALDNSPANVVFVLIDYKGGSAFDRCADLPHVVGVVTDLDDHLAQRALQSLEAELQHRERLLRAADVSDIGGYRQAGSPGGPLPRLVVVIDEFATLRTELPDFVTSLVSIAQRGRSLGVHLVLATQRPSGAVDANIRANTNLRVALRVQSSADSTDVIDASAAAAIPRALPGRGFVRRGQADLVAVQTAFLSSPARRELPPFRIEPLAMDAHELDAGPASDPAGVGSRELPTELDELVATVVAAALEFPAPRRPWLDDLPLSVEPGDIGDVKGSDGGDVRGVPLLLGDEPGKQRRVVRGWSPSTGHLAVVGVRGSGVSTTLCSVIAGLGTEVIGRGESVAPWVFAADHAGGGLAVVHDWPHVGCCLEPTETARHRRLLTVIEAEFDRRRGLPVAEVALEPQIVLVVDGVAGFFETLGAEPATPISDLVGRIVRDGPSLRIALVVGAERPGDIPRMLRSQIRDTVVLEQASANDFDSLGVSTKPLPSFVPGRALFGPDHMVCQVVDRSSSFDPSTVPVGVAPPAIIELSTSIARHELGEASVGGDLSVPIGKDVTTHADAVLVVRTGDHALVAGPAGSGRTTTLQTIAEQLRSADDDVVLVGVRPAEGAASLLSCEALDAGGTVDEIEHVLRMATTDDRRWVILVDDAERIDRDDGPLVDLARNASLNVTVIAAVRSSAVRGGYGHWTRVIRSSGLGVLLTPDTVLDGDVLGVRLPRTERTVQAPGRAYLVSGHAISEIQIARCGAREMGKE